MSYITVDTEVEVDIDRVLDAMTVWEKNRLTNELVIGGYGTARIREEAAMDDEATRLAAIVWLRENGWTVEPK